MEENQFRTLKEVYEELLEYGQLSLDGVEMAIEDHEITTFLATIKNGEEFIYFRKYGGVVEDRQQLELLDCIHITSSNSNVRYYKKMYRPLPDFNASVGFFTTF